LEAKIQRRRASHATRKTREASDFTTVVEDKDDNELIIERIKERLEIGLENYGHGVIIHDDVKQYGTKRNDWTSMCEEEIMDGLIYAAAAAIRQEEKEKRRITHVRELFQRLTAAEEERDLLQTQIDNLWVTLKLVHAAAMDEHGYDPEAGLQESVQDFLDNNFTEEHQKLLDKYASEE